MSGVGCNAIGAMQSASFNERNATGYIYNASQLHARCLNAVVRLVPFHRG